MRLGDILHLESQVVILRTKATEVNSGQSAGQINAHHKGDYARNVHNLQNDCIPSEFLLEKYK